METPEKLNDNENKCKTDRVKMNIDQKQWVTTKNKAQRLTSVYK